MSDIEDDLRRRLCVAALEAAREEPTELSFEAVAQLGAALIEVEAFWAVLRRSPLVARHRANVILKACVLLINSNPAWREMNLTAPLVQLSGALDDLSLGWVQPILRPELRDRQDTGPRSRFDSRLRGYVAGIIEGLMAHAAMKEFDAAKWVNERLGKAGLDIKPDKLIEWRKQARHPKKNAVMREAFFKVKAQDWADPKATAERLVMAFAALR